MLKTLWNSRSGLYSTQNKMDAISNNIANVETNGYKKIDVSFQDIMYEKMDRMGLPVTLENKDKLIQGSGSRGESLVRDSKEGVLISTGKKTDMAIVGNGFFRVIDDRGNYYYTRDGAFNLDKNGKLVHSSGMILQIDGMNNGDIKPEFSVNKAGEVIEDNQTIGKIYTYKFLDNDAMKSVEGVYTTDEMPVRSNALIQQGYLENSNVDLSKELSDMIITQRTFSLNSRAIKTGDDMWQIANNLRNK